MTIAGSAQELLAQASSRQRVEPADARAGAVHEDPEILTARLSGLPGTSRGGLNENIRPSQPAAEPVLA